MQQNHISSAINVFLDDLDFKMTHPNEINGLKTGLIALDHTLNGIKKKE